MIPGERTLTVRDRMVGACGPYATSFTLAWLATHRGRLRSLWLGGKRLTVAIVWDSDGNRTVEHSDREVEALRQIVYGDPPA